MVASPNLDLPTRQDCKAKPREFGEQDGFVIFSLLHLYVHGLQRNLKAFASHHDSIKLPMSSFALLALCVPSDHYHFSPRGDSRFGG
jgi:hypothetical protein